MSETVLIVDDNEVIRRSLKSIFANDANFKVCGEAVNGADAVEKAKNLKPSLVVLDFQMPVMNGLEAAPKIIQSIPNVCIILFTMFGDGYLERAARAVGIHAIIHKDDPTKILPTAHSLLKSKPSKAQGAAN